ncbi:MAG TPA: hypothetical protein VNI20_14070, partial [Fimbriimonadaceae bacterium]|nr:hypothetical protein [Fimbriimonadaceae bacterium]
DGERQDPYMLEHKDLIASIRGGKAVNEGVRVAHSTMTAIMGRMSCYTGQEVTWDMAMNSQLSLIPDTLNFQEQIEVPPVAMPGTTKFM